MAFRTCPTSCPRLTWPKNLCHFGGLLTSSTPHHQATRETSRLKGASCFRKIAWSMRFIWGTGLASSACKSELQQSCLFQQGINLKYPELLVCQEPRLRMRNGSSASSIAPAFRGLMRGVKGRRLTGKPFNRLSHSPETLQLTRDPTTSATT